MWLVLRRDQRSAPPLRDGHAASRTSLASRLGRPARVSGGRCPIRNLALLDCAAWHAEVIAEDDGYVFVREWHSIERPQFPSATANPETRAIAGTARLTRHVRGDHSQRPLRAQGAVPARPGRYATCLSPGSPPSRLTSPPTSLPPSSGTCKQTRRPFSPCA